MSEDNPLPHPEPSPALEGIYTFGYGPTAVQIITSRSAEDSARFFLPYLRAGMRVLDCGCGPGSITVGLAQAVTPGEAVGIDLEPSQIALAQTYAAERGVANARFETGNIYALPFPDATFDAAFGHTIVMQFRDPVQALTEVYRVLKPGGVVGFREVDFDGNLCNPPDAAWQQFWELFARVLQHNGGNARVGKRLGGLLRLAGFGRIAMSPGYIMTGGTPEQRRLLSEVTARFCEEVAFIEQARELGWVDEDTRARLSAALRAEGARAEGFFAVAVCKVVGWKEDPTP
jgi:ubiquinone/menaquinone biosynthesis C-methylase UbiE